VIKSSTFKSGYVGELNPGRDDGERRNRSRAATGDIVNAPGVLATYYSRARSSRIRRPSIVCPTSVISSAQASTLPAATNEVFNAGGEKIAFSLIESFLREAPGIADCRHRPSHRNRGPAGRDHRLGRPSRTGPRPAQRPPLPICQGDRCRAKLHLVRLNEIARNATGKVDRQGLVAAYRQAIPGIAARKNPSPPWRGRRGGIEFWQARSLARPAQRGGCRHAHLLAMEGFGSAPGGRFCRGGIRRRLGRWRRAGLAGAPCQGKGRRPRRRRWVP